MLIPINQTRSIVLHCNQVNCHGKTNIRLSPRCLARPFMHRQRQEHLIQIWLRMYLSCLALGRWGPSHSGFQWRCQHNPHDRYRTREGKGRDCRDAFLQRHSRWKRIGKSGQEELWREGLEGRGGEIDLCQFLHGPGGVPAFAGGDEWEHDPGDESRYWCQWTIFLVLCNALLTSLQAGIITVDPEDAKAMFYQDLPEDVVRDLARKLRPQSMGVYWSRTHYAAWRHIPTTYIVCKQDAPSTVAAVRWLISTARESGNHKLDTVIERDVGHTPFISQPEWTAQVLMEAAGRMPEWNRCLAQRLEFYKRESRF